MKTCNWSRAPERARQFDAHVLRVVRRGDVPNLVVITLRTGDATEEYGGRLLPLQLSLPEAHVLLDRLAHELDVPLGSGTRSGGRRSDADGRL